MEGPNTNKQKPGSSGSRLGSIMLHFSWIAMIALMAFLMQGWLDQRHNPNSEPVVTINNGQQQLILQRNPYGHYVASGQINGHKALFMLDTGATDVVIPAGLTEKYGLEYGYPSQARTANGVVTVYSTRLDRVALGPIELHNVRASINPHMDGDEILLGMSFLKQVSLTQYQDKLIISNPQANL